MNENIMTVKIVGDGTNMFYSYTVKYNKVGDLVNSCKELLIKLADIVNKKEIGKYEIIYEPEISKTNATLLFNHFKKLIKP